MLTYYYGQRQLSFEGGESVVVESELLLSAAASLAFRSATTATTATAATSASTSLLREEVVLLTLEMEKVGKLGLANSNIVDFLILKSVHEGLNLLSLGLSSLELDSLDLLMASAFLLSDGLLLVCEVLSKGKLALVLFVLLINNGSGLGNLNLCLFDWGILNLSLFNGGGLTFSGGSLLNFILNSSPVALASTTLGEASASASAVLSVEGVLFSLLSSEVVLLTFIVDLLLSVGNSDTLVTFNSLTSVSSGGASASSAATLSSRSLLTLGSLGSGASLATTASACASFATATASFASATTATTTATTGSRFLTSNTVEASSIDFLSSGGLSSSGSLLSLGSGDGLGLSGLLGSGLSSGLSNRFVIFVSEGCEHSLSGCHFSC